MTTFMFVGERRSNLAKKMGVTWLDGRLAAKQLFDALRAININPDEQFYCNRFEYGGLTAIRSCIMFNKYMELYGCKSRIVVVALGNLVSARLKKDKIEHIKMVHPAARGKIRKKERYIKHVFETLSNSLTH